MIDPKDAARSAVAQAIQASRLVQQPCTRCGHSPAEAHHEDYSRPLDVTWLCRKCHRVRHREINPPPGDLRVQTIRLPASVWQKLRLLAAAKGTTSIGELRAALEQHFEREWPEVRARLDAA